MKWTTACPDWETRIRAGQSLIPFSPLFPDEAEKSLEVFRSLRIVDAANSPTIGESCRPWIMDFAGSVFGAYNHETGRRLVREFFLLISKKNSKSCSAAAIMMTALIRNWRMSNEFLILAPTIEVANNSFKPAYDMVQADPALQAILYPQQHIRTITHRTTGASLKVVAADDETVSGKKAAGVLVDELWLFGKKPNAENMLREATGGLASRPEGFVIYLSTMADDPPAGIFKQKLNYFRDVRDGIIKDNKSLGVLYEFPKAMIEAREYLDPKNFGITNPNLGLSVDREFIEDQFKQAQAAGPESLRGFLAKHLNVEIGMNLRSDRWAGADSWEACGDPSLTFDAIMERCDLVVVGIDGGGLDDLLGMAVIGRCRETGKWLLWSHAWAHQSVLDRRKDIVSKLRDFERDGDLTVVENIGDDVEGVADYVEQLESAGLLPKKAAIGVDQAGIDEIVDTLGRRGIAIDRFLAVPQGWKLTNAIKTAERKVVGGGLIHGATGLMAWMVANAKVEPKGNAVIITKQNAGNAKIDAFMAFLDAVVAMGQNPETGPSVYESAEFVV